MCMPEGTFHFLHKDFGSSVFVVPGKCSKSGNTYFAAVPGTERTNILEKFAFVCRYAATYDFLTCVCVNTDRPRNVVLRVPLGGVERTAGTRTITFQKV